MKNIISRIGIILIIIVAAIVACFSIWSTYVVAAPSQTQVGTVSSKDNQQSFLDDLSKTLKNDGIPFNTLQIENDARWNPAFVVTYVIQSSSNNDKITPIDPIYLNRVGHEVQLAKQRGLSVGAIHEIVQNIRGKTILNDYQATYGGETIVASVSKPSLLNNDMINTLLTNSDMKEITDNIQVTLTEDGQHEVMFIINSFDITNNNTDVVNILNTIQNNILNVNRSEGSQIALYQINILDITGNPLLFYVNDVQFGRQSWWQSAKIKERLGI